MSWTVTSVRVVTKTNHAVWKKIPLINLSSLCGKRRGDFGSLKSGSHFTEDNLLVWPVFGKNDMSKITRHLERIAKHSLL